MSGRRATAALPRYHLVRSRQRASVLLAIALCALVASALSTWILDGAERTGSAALRTAVVTGEPADGAEVLASDLRRPEAEQDRTVREDVERAFAGAPLVVRRVVVAGPLTVRGSDVQVLAARADEDVMDAAEAVAGSMAAVRGDGVAIDQAGAATLHVSVGGRIVLTTDGGPVGLRVAALWRPTDAGDRRWAALPPGGDGAAARLIVPPALFEPLASISTARWVVTPDPGRIRLADLGRLVAGFASVDRVVAADARIGTPAVVTSGAALSTVTGAAQASAALRSLLPGALALLAGSLLVAAALLARVLWSARAAESRLLLSRGAGRLGGAAAVEMGLVAVVGAAIGALLAQLLLLTSGQPDGWLLPVLVPLAVAVLVAATGTAVARRALLAAELGGPAAGRIRSVVATGLPVLLVVLAGVTLWRFVLYGLPDGDAAPDPVGLLAPAAMLCAAAVVALAALPPIARSGERAATRARGLGALPLVRIGRGLGLVAAPVAALAIAVGAIVGADAFAATWADYSARSDRFVLGGDVRTAQPTGVGPGATAGGASTLPALSAARGADPRAVVTVARRTPAQLGDRELTVVGTASKARGAVGVRLPPGATRLDLRMTTSSIRAVTASLTGWFVADDGRVVAASDALAPHVGLALPGDATWTLSGLDLVLRSDATVRNVTVGIRDATADVRGSTRSIPLPRAEWRLAAEAFPVGSAVSTGPLGAFVPRLRADSPVQLRLVPAGGATAAVDVSRALARAADIGPGDDVLIDEEASRFHARVARVVDAVRGTTGGPAVQGDLRRLAAAELRASPALSAVDELRITTTDPARTARRLAARLGPGADVAVASPAVERRFLGAGVDGVRLAAAGDALLALVALVAALVAVRRGRQGEVAVLRALGVTSRQQSRAAWLEGGAAAGYALLAGSVAGVLVAVLTVPTLARLAAPSAPRVLAPGLQADAGLVVELALLAGCVAVVVATHAALLRREAGEHR